MNSSQSNREIGQGFSIAKRRFSVRLTEKRWTLSLQMSFPGSQGQYVWATLTMPRYNKNIEVLKDQIKLIYMYIWVIVNKTSCGFYIFFSNTVLCFAAIRTDRKRIVVNQLKPIDN